MDGGKLHERGAFKLRVAPPSGSTMMVLMDYAKC